MTDTKGLLAGDKFPLLRRLSTACLAVMLIAATALILLYWQDQLSEHRAIAAQNNEKTLNYLTRSLDEQINALLANSNAADTQAIKMDPNIDVLITSTLDMLDVSDLLKLKIFNLSGATVYSTFRGDIGGTSPHPDWLAKALHGETVHHLEFRDVFAGLHGEMHDVYVALTCMPLTHAGKHIGAIEIYRDTTALYKHRQAKVIEITLIVFAAFILLYAALIFIVFRMDRAVAKWQRLVIESEEQLRNVIAGASLGYWDWNYKTGAHDVNDRWLEMLGLDRSDIANDVSDWDARIYPDDKQRVLPIIEASLANGKPYIVEFRMRHQDGHWVWIQGSGTVISYDPVSNEPLRVCGTHQDISERKKMEERLQLTQFVSDHAPDCILWVDEQARICYANEAAARKCGYTKEEMLAMSIPDIDPDFPADVWPAHWQELREQGTLNFETRHRRRDGSIFPIEVSANFVRFGDKEYNIAFMRDITARKEAERKTKTLLQAIENAGEAVLITDKNAVIEYVNPAFTGITGYSPEEIIGQSPAALKSSAQDPAFYKELWGTITRGEVWHGTLIDRRKDGSFYPALMSIAPIHNGGGEITHYVALQQDMTAYKKMEEQFLQAQKMEAIGTLVGGIAHDFNNMLAAIEGNVYLAKRKLKHQPEVDAKLDSIELLGTRAADMVKQLLTFARKDRMTMSPLSLNSFIKEGFKLVVTAIPENIELVCDSCQEELSIKGDATQLQQVLMNLLNNARDAASHVSQPRISCSLSPFTATADFVKAHPDIKGKLFAELTVSDNGDGIEEEHLQKVFEPFFTTKGVGEGTGLGLAMVYGAVQSHGGAIEVESGKGKGTAFHIYLPLMEGAENPVYEKERTAIQGRGETILLVDDEESMRSTTCEVLDSLGYKVLSAGDGKEALEIFREHQTDISLLITDVVMPKIGGVDLAKTIRLLDKKLPIIFATGYAKDQAMSPGDQVEQSIILSKPFSYDKLSQLIWRMIDAN